MLLKPQKGVAHWVIMWPRARAQMLSITQPTADSDPKRRVPQA
jgi:hypothetical protein